jgi:hypothetical protein
VSLDGVTADVFERIRVRSRFEDVVGNLDRIRKLVADHPRATICVTFSVMKFNILELPNLVRFCTGRELGYNLLPVVSFPVDQSLRCFTDPVAQMAGWRESIASARRLLEDVFLPTVPFGQRLAHIYRGHLTALEGLIPWDKLAVPHYRVRRRVPAVALRMYEPPRLAGALQVGFFRLRDGVPGECEYYAPVVDGRYEVCLPEGRFLAVLFPRNNNPVPTVPCRWHVTVARGGVSRQAGPPIGIIGRWAVRTGRRALRNLLAGNWRRSGSGGSEVASPAKPKAEARS